MPMTIPADVPQASSTKGGSSRRHARQLALQLLFQQEFQTKHEEWEDHFWKDHQSASRNVRIFATDLLQGVKEHQRDIDLLIQKFAVDWTITRMPVVDRNILRCAIYELLWVQDIPAAVTINEAIDLAKCFADDEAQRFVNGILDHILHDDERLTEKRKYINQSPGQSESQPKPTA